MPQYNTNSKLGYEFLIWTGPLVWKAFDPGIYNQGTLLGGGAIMVLKII
jgi:hypothetical protein